jgi:hypothetical protein
VQVSRLPVEGVWSPGWRVRNPQSRRLGGAPAATREVAAGVLGGTLPMQWPAGALAAKLSNQIALAGARGEASLYPLFKIVFRLYKTSRQATFRWPAARLRACLIVAAGS